MEDLHERLYKAIREHSDMDDGQIVEAGTYGADAGWPGFTYTRDAVEFFEKNRDDIWELAREEADQLGEPNVMAMVAQFGRADMLDTPNGFENLMAWYALEEIGRWLETREEEEEDG